MIHETGDMWTAYESADLFLITTNACVKDDRALVMGRGIAAQARDRFPGLDRALGARIWGMRQHKGVYGLLVSDRWPAARLGAFQVKYSWEQSALTSLIEYSAGMLCIWCAQHPDAVVHLNYPGIGNGGLPLDAVAPLLEQLPDTVHVWTFR